MVDPENGEDFFGEKSRRRMLEGAYFDGMICQLEPWDWWFTGSFAREYSAMSAARCFEAYARKLDAEVKYLYVIEANRYRLGTHVHALLGNVDHITYAAGGQEWFRQYGYVYIRPYRGKLSRRLGQYLSKYMTKDMCWWNIRVPGQLRFGSRKWKEQRHSLGNVAPILRHVREPVTETRVEYVTTSRLTGCVSQWSRVEKVEKRSCATEGQVRV